MMKSSSIFIVLLTCSTSSWAGFFGIDDETKTKMVENNLTAQQICKIYEHERDYVLENGRHVYKGRQFPNGCSESDIKMNHVDEAINRRSMSKRNLETINTFKSKCTEVGGTLEDETFQKNEFDSGASASCAWGRWKKHHSRDLDKFRVEADQYLNERNAKHAEWAKQAEQFTTIKELCTAIDNESNTSAAYDEDMRTCSISTSYSELFDKYRYMEPIVRVKDNQQAAIEAAQNPEKWRKEAESYKGTLEELCKDIQIEKFNSYSDGRWIPDSLECKTSNKYVDEKYAFMKPLLIKQNDELLALRKKEKEASFAQTEAMKKKEAAKWMARLGKTLPLKPGSFSKCEPEPKWSGLLKSMYGDVKFELNYGRATVQLGKTIFHAEDEYKDSFLYTNTDPQTLKRSTLMILKKSGIGGGNTNISFNNIGFYCE